MGLNLFFKNAIKSAREQYVEEFKVKDNVKLEPCDKYVACISKLTKNYVLALRDVGVESLQVANQNDSEFFEGYDITPEYTDEVRKNLALKIRQVSESLGLIATALDRLMLMVSYDVRQEVGDVKNDIGAINDIVGNIYTCITMTAEKLNYESGDLPNGLRELLDFIKQRIIDVVKNLADISQGTIIGYISKQIDNIIDRMLNYFNEIASAVI